MEKRQDPIAGNVFYMLKLTKEYMNRRRFGWRWWILCAAVSARGFSIFIPKIAVDMVLGNSNVTWLSFCLFLGNGRSGPRDTDRDAGNPLSVCK